MEMIIGYIPEKWAKTPLSQMADEIAEECGKIWGRKEHSVPVILHKQKPEDGNKKNSETMVFYVYAGVGGSQSREVREKVSMKIFEASQKRYADLKKENHVVIFKLHEAEDMGVNGKFEE